MTRVPSYLFSHDVKEWGNETEPFSKSQLILAAQCIMAAVLERIDGEIETPERREEGVALTAYERGALEAAGMALAVLYIQVSGDDEGLTIGDALGSSFINGVAFDTMIKIWVDDTVNFRKTAIAIHPPLEPKFPNSRPWAEAWVERLFPREDLTLDKLPQA